MDTAGRVPSFPELESFTVKSKVLFTGKSFSFCGCRINVTTPALCRPKVQKRVSMAVTTSKRRTRTGRLKRDCCSDSGAPFRKESFAMMTKRDYLLRIYIQISPFWFWDTNCVVAWASPFRQYKRISGLVIEPRTAVYRPLDLACSGRKGRFDCCSLSPSSGFCVVQPLKSRRQHKSSRILWIRSIRRAWGMTAFSKISYLTDSKRVALLLMPACEWSCRHQRTFDVKDSVDSVGRNHIST